MTGTGTSTIQGWVVPGVNLPYMIIRGLVESWIANAAPFLSTLSPLAGKLVTNQPHDEEVDLDSEGSIEYENADRQHGNAGVEDSQDDMG